MPRFSCAETKGFAFFPLRLFAAAAAAAALALLACFSCSSRSLKSVLAIVGIGVDDLEVGSLLLLEETVVAVLACRACPPESLVGEVGDVCVDTSDVIVKKTGADVDGEAGPAEYSAFVSSRGGSTSSCSAILTEMILPSATMPLEYQAKT